MPWTKSIAVLCSLALFAIFPTETFAADGQISGAVTDQKGAAIVGAAVKITGGDAGGQAVTDGQGRYQVTDLPDGTYSVVIVAAGFAEAKREGVQISAAKRQAVVDVRLDVGALDAGNVEVKADEPPAAKTDPVYQRLRRLTDGMTDLNGTVATVSELTLKRDAATFTLRSGEIYFLPPVEGRVTGGVFIGEEELKLVPPIEAERRGLAMFTGQPDLTEKFSHLILRFTDQTFGELKSSPAAKLGTSGAAARRARDLYRDHLQLVRKELRANLDAQTLCDLYAPGRPGFFTAFVNGQRFKKLIFQLNPLGIPEVSPEEVMLASYGDTDGGVWTAFHLGEEYRGTERPAWHEHRLFDIADHRIDVSIKGTRLRAEDQLTINVLRAGARVLPFDLYRTLRVKSVRDDEGRELNFVQEDKDEDADFFVILPRPLDVKETYRLTVQYEGEDALRDSGGGNYILLPRSTWYPNNGGSQFGDRATFRMTFRYPKNNLLVATGTPEGTDAEEGETHVSKWSSGATELAVAGFNYGRFKMKEIADESSGYRIQFYANREVPGELRQLQMEIDQLESRGVKTMTTLSSISTARMADSALIEAQNSARLYNAFFGRLPYTRFAMTQQPAMSFGQAWPTLVFMPYTAFIDATQRIQLLGARGGLDNFWRHVGPHEIAHQWWGHTVGWKSYRDQWMSEGFAEFSSSIYVQYIERDINKFVEFWEEQRRSIVEARPQTMGRRPYTVGPITQGFRLSNAKTGAAYRFTVYPKGAYVLHMLRMMMYDARQGGDKRFQAMMNDFIRTHYNKDVSTEDFQKIVDKHLPPELDLDGNKRADWFFDQWVYGTEVPSYKLDYQLAQGADGKTALTGRITQSGVSDAFRMVVPLYVDYGKGWVKLGAASLNGNSGVDLPPVPLPQAPKRVAVCALNDVLALSVENNKH